MNLQEEFNSRYLYDNGKLYNRKTGKETGNTKHGRYFVITFLVDGKKKKFKVHRVIWVMHKGDIPEDLVIDHVDRNPHNNLLENLRLATLSQNSANSIGYNKAGLPKGVSLTGKKYQARIKYNNIVYYLGLHNTIEEAAEAYKLKAEEFHGEFVKL